MPYSYVLEIQNHSEFIIGRDETFMIIERKRTKVPAFYVFGLPFFIKKTVFEETVLCILYSYFGAVRHYKSFANPKDHIKFVEFVADQREPLRHAIIEMYL